MIRNAIAAFDEIDDDRPPAGIYGRSRLADSRMGWAQRDVGGSGLDTARARICARESGAAGRCGRAAKALCHSGRLHPPILPLFDASPADEPALSWPHPIHHIVPWRTRRRPRTRATSSRAHEHPRPPATRPPRRAAMPAHHDDGYPPATTSSRGAQDDGPAPAPRHPAQDAMRVECGRDGDVTHARRVLGARAVHSNPPPLTVYAFRSTGPGDCSMNATDQFVEAMGLHSLAIDDADFADGMMESMDCMINQVPLVEVVWCWAIGREMRDRISYHPILNKEMHSKASIGSTIEMA
ncbi:hypothetical protein BJ912DRAFT_1041465 [Pholiota molesta]|nr:hypothetical protein BJ912DRAFT_1041465 [Pholiota molesta]